LKAITLNGMTAFSVGGAPLQSAEELEATLRQIGAARYHNLHPFHRLLHGGKLNKGQVQAWALNRYYYQSTIPIKDAVVISRFRDRTIRREWRHRIEDHDGDIGSEGGIDRWLKLTEGLGLDSAYVESTEGILPATRFAVEAYVHFVRDKSPLEAIASSLTELFAPNLHEERISGMLAHYDFVRLQRADLQDQCAMGPARRAVSCLCRRPHPAGRICAQVKLERRNGIRPQHQCQRGEPAEIAASCQAEIR
jgi:pyrroloquinoline-quinone synthase